MHNTYVTRSVGCRIVPIDYTVYERRDGVPVVVGYAQLIAYQYIGTAADTPYWAHEITVSPAIMTGLAAEGLHVAGLPNCLTSPGNCALYDYSFPVSVLETVGSEESGLAEWEWPVVAGGQGTSNTSWSLQESRCQLRSAAPADRSSSARRQQEQGMPAVTAEANWKVAVDRRGELPDRQRPRGLDQHHFRRWDSWHRWTTLAMVGYAFLTILATVINGAEAATAETELIAVMLAEARRLLTDLRARTAVTTAQILSWSRWRRRRQHRARTAHYRSREAAGHSPDLGL